MRGRIPSHSAILYADCHDPSAGYLVACNKDAEHCRIHSKRDW